MSYRLGAFSGVRLTQAQVRSAIGGHERGALPRFERLWTYYRNPLRPVGTGGMGSFAGAAHSGRWYSQAQEAGLPARIRGTRDSQTDDRAPRREIVIENDIAWRVQAMVDFMFGKPIAIRSAAPDASRRATIERILSQVWENSGGIALLQDIALLGHVFGHVDLLLRVDEPALEAALREVTGGTHRATAALDAAASALRVEAIDPRRGIPIVNADDYRRLDAYIIRGGGTRRTSENDAERSTGLASLVRSILGASRPDETPNAPTDITEIISAEAWHIYRGNDLAWEQSRPWTPGEVPVVHIQNISQPLEYEGLGEVEPLVPLQDELNTRLSDRACRVTLQSFKMYLAKGIENLGHVGPGQVWFTDNPDASIEAFGGDADSPSEAAHIREVREALDKASGVPPLSGGVVQGRIGNLSSATALRITLMGLTAKTARKHVTYGRGIARMCALILSALDTAGVLDTTNAERAVTLDWPDPLPVELPSPTASPRTVALPS